MDEVSRPSAEELAAIPAFACLSPEDIAAAAPLFTIRSYARNEIVSHEGDAAELFNFVLSGNVQAFWRDDEGHQLRLGIDEPGYHFPDHTLGGASTVVSHVAISELRLASIRRADLHALMREHPQIAVVVLMDVAARLRRMLARSKMLTMEDVYTRVVRLLTTGAVEADGKLVCARLTHAEIGQSVGATREMVGRVLRDLARGGYISTEGDRMLILRKPPSRW